MMVRGEQIIKSYNIVVMFNGAAEKNRVADMARSFLSSSEHIDQSAYDFIKCKEGLFFLNAKTKPAKFKDVKDGLYDWKHTLEKPLQLNDDKDAGASGVGPISLSPSADVTIKRNLDGFIQVNVSIHHYDF